MVSLKGLKYKLAHQRDALMASLEEWRYSNLFREILTTEKASQLLGELVAAGRPAAVGRMGRTEARILGQWQYRKGNYSRKNFKQAHAFAGVFPVDHRGLSAFAEIYLRGIEALDVLAFWPTEYQAKIAGGLDPRPHLIQRLDLEPFLSATPWSKQLQGKKVLVVHPFKESILRQYQRSRQHLFADADVLPEFDLEVIRAPQCMAGQTAGFSSWSEAFGWLKEQVRQADFDIAIIGCGAFGLPLAAACKQMGRIGLHTAGATQLLFGIYGDRWLKDASYQHLFNDHWIRPDGADLLLAQIKGQVDEECYKDYF